MKTLIMLKVVIIDTSRLRSAVQTMRCGVRRQGYHAPYYDGYVAAVGTDSTGVAPGLV